MTIDFGKYVGIPFADHGRDERGCDCWGLLRLFYRREKGIELPDLGPLYRDALADAAGMLGILGGQRPLWARVALPAPGDAVLLNAMGWPVHVGVAVDHRRMLHVQRGCGAVIERFDSALWKRRLEGFYRLK